MDVTVAGVSLSEYRRHTRASLLGDDDRPLVVTGHQPEFIHPGVWSKHVVAARLAEAVGGHALNLVVDSQVPKTKTLAVPGLRNRTLCITSIRVSDAPAGVPFERFTVWGDQDWTRLRCDVDRAMGDRFAASLMPAFLDAVPRCSHPRDWVDQMVFARDAVDRSLGLELIQRRVSEAWFGPLLAELIVNAHRFATCYNAALADYRRAHRVRSPQRPIPDLIVDGPRCEVAVWVLDGIGRRHRLHVECAGPTLRLLADASPIGEFPADALSAWDRAQTLLANLAPLSFRPRALTLTLWARLCLADLFVHGIGGAKYDRITDRLMTSYFGVPPPAMGCASATLRLDLPCNPPDAGIVRDREHRLRDLRHNPQRHLRCEDELRQTTQRRAMAVAESDRLRREDPSNRAVRRDVFEQIRSLSRQMLTARPALLAEYEAAVAEAGRRRTQSGIAQRRDYFIGLFSADRLRLLLERLPATADFRV